ncbi:MAG: hypothetical protein AB8B69_22065 [Chitinophagales bacterium]
MLVKERIISELNQLTIDKLEIVLQFIKLQKSLENTIIANYIASESSLKKDWLKPVEDEAWQDL